MEVTGRGGDDRETDDEIRFALIDEEGCEIELSQGENIIGRSPDAAVRIDSFRVSHRHATIFIEGTTATVDDLGSKNGTYLRGRRVEGPTRIEDDDEIQIGADLARFRVRVRDDRTRTDGSVAMTKPLSRAGLLLIVGFVAALAPGAAFGQVDCGVFFLPWDLILASALASRSKRARRLGSAATSNGSTLIATSRSRSSSRARNTSPIPPAPIRSRMVK